MVVALVAVCIAWVQPSWGAGTLKVAVPSNLNTLDPAKTKIGEEYIVNFLVFSGLTEIDRNGKTIPDLAERWTASDDLKTWTFYLRKGVKFHHGRDVDAQDVITTVQRIQDKATGSVTRVNFEVIDKMEAVDANTVRFTLKAPYAGLADIFSDRQARIEEEQTAEGKYAKEVAQHSRPYRAVTDPVAYSRRSDQRERDKQ